jgi:hypothetical protein
LDALLVFGVGGFQDKAIQLVEVPSKMLLQPYWPGSAALLCT